MDSNHDIVQTLRLFDGVMTGLTADEIEALRKRVAELEAAAVSPATAESKCTRCGSSTAQACNELGCFYLESGDGEPATADATDYAAIERAELGDPDKKTGIYAATADELAALALDVFKRHTPVWLNKYPDVCRQIADELFARASQAAAPASHPLKQPMLICAGLAAAPAEAREPFPYQKTFDAIAAATSITAGGHVSISVEAFRKAFGAVPADAGEAVATVVAALRKLVHLKSLKDGADRCVPGYIEDRIEYQRDKPKAWDDARAALASFDAAQGAQGGKGGDRG